MSIITTALQKLTDQQDLTPQQTEEMMTHIMQRQANEIQLAAILTALKIKGETPTEIASMAKIMRKFAIQVPSSKPLLDTCGTGGDKSKSINISTTVAFVLAAGGVKVAKHGNRSITSQSGGVDTLEALGININLSPTQIQKCLDQLNLGFIFAQLHHPGLKHIMPVRKNLGFSTIFNILGPLTNPAQADHQIIGVYNPDLTNKIAQSLQILNLKQAMVIHGSGLDEVALHGPTQISHLKNQEVSTYTITPQDFQIPPASLQDIQGGSPEENAQTLKQTLAGKIHGPKRDIIVLNAALGFHIWQSKTTLKQGLQKAQEILDSKAAYQKLKDLQEFSHSFNS